jgi:hypothetical protein
MTRMQAAQKLVEHHPNAVVVKSNGLYRVFNSPPLWQGGIGGSFINKPLSAWCPTHYAALVQSAKGLL